MVWTSLMFSILTRSTKKTHLYYTVFLDQGNILSKVPNEGWHNLWCHWCKCLRWASQRILAWRSIFHDIQSFGQSSIASHFPGVQILRHLQQHQVNQGWWGLLLILWNFQLHHPPSKTLNDNSFVIPSLVASDSVESKKCVWDLAVPPLLLHVL